jgi:hypothetical protein
VSDPAATNPTPPAPTDGASAGAPPAGSAPAAPPVAASDQPNWAPFSRVALIAAVVGWATFGVASMSNLGAAEGDDAKHAAQSRIMVGYLSGFTYWFSLPLGAMCLLMIRYVAKSSWGLLLTRPLEAATRTLPLTILLFVPLAGAVCLAHGKFSPYPWSHHHDEHKDDAKAEKKEEKADVPAGKREQAMKASDILVEREREHQRQIHAAHESDAKNRFEAIFGFLTPGGFVAVSAVLFLIWGTMIFLLNKWGKETSAATDPTVVDRGLEKLQNLSGPGIIVFALTITAASTQWVMSLEVGWASTMFPVIFAVNQFLTAFAFCLALFLTVCGMPPFKAHMRPKFQLDMGTLLLAFTMFWSYTSFSQFMLIWIGNLPEEIPFYLKRSNETGWYYVSAALIALHFALPFLLLLFRNIKLHPGRLRLVALYLLVICAIDVIWWIAPSAAESAFAMPWLIDAGAILGIGGVWGLFFLYQLKQRPLFPDNQAFLLPEGHHHEQH